MSPKDGTTLFTLIARINLQSIPVAVWLVAVFFVVVVILVIVTTVRNRRDRAETRLRAQEMGWLYGESQPAETAGNVSFRIQYSYTGATRGIPWTYTYSTKTVNHPPHYVSSSSGRRKTTGSTTVSGRTDWRATAVKSPSMVLVMPHMKTPALLSMFTPTPEAIAANMLSLGLTDSEKQGSPTVGLAAGGVGLFTNPNAPTAEYGLKEIADLADDTFNIYAQDEAAAHQVINEQARAALEAWKTAFSQRYGSRAKSQAIHQPCILFNPDGLYIFFKDEDSKIAALEATVDLGTRLAAAQGQAPV